ncbi:MAG: hypothetical protein IJK81_04435 [Selenomonadaceae bacterium]|nr:hypothetical protein [Selenomonadaceae bacterium]
MFRNNSGGFVFAEFAIALPLLILLGWGLATVSLKLFDVGKNQLADYVLEEEVHDVLSRLIYDARAAKKVIAENGAPTLTFTYRMIKAGTANSITTSEDKRIYILAGGLGNEGSKINYKRVTYYLGNPITGNNYFGETRVTQFKFSQPKNKISGEPLKNVLHITLELESEITHHKIKISTAVYMPSCEEFKIYD